MFSFHSVTEFGVEGFGEPDYRELKQQFAEADSGDWVLMPRIRTARTRRCSI